MNLNKYKLAIIYLVGVLLTSIVLGCFVISQDFSTMEMEDGAKISQCCISGDSNFINHLSPDIKYLSASDSMALLTANFILAIIVFLFIKSNILVNYYLIKERYGGFKLFYKFLLLFKNGLLHPKLY